MSLHTMSSELRRALATIKGALRPDKRKAQCPIPIQFQLLGHTIRVEFDDLRCGGDDTEGLLGEWDLEALTVRLEETMSEESLVVETFCHEVMEAINNLLELDLHHHEIQKIGAAWHQVLTSLVVEEDD